MICVRPSVFSLTDFTSLTSSRIACASFGVSVFMPCVPLRMPLTLREPAATQMRLSPSLSSSDSDACVPARPIDTTQITVATATVMPRIASAARTLLRPSERTGSIVNKRRITRRRATSAYIPALLDVKRARIHLPLRSLGQNPHVRLAVCLVALLAGAARAQPGDRVPVTLEPALAGEGEVDYDDKTQVGYSAWARSDAHVGLALDLPIFARIGDRARSARATETAQRTRLAALEAELGGRLVAAYQRWQAASERLAAMERDVIPAQEKAATLSMQAYREGARDLSSAVLAERDLASARAELNDARAQAALAYAALAVAIGDDVHAKSR